mmetsp:Transcript_145966/g.254849  ORF Transcript_145966/g.254849 Transcript_145966/m.254849 type:complete len:267 (+) Transcript_145966:556-1356(+)
MLSEGAMGAGKGAGTGLWFSTSWLVLPMSTRIGPMLCWLRVIITNAASLGIAFSSWEMRPGLPSRGWLFQVSTMSFAWMPAWAKGPSGWTCCTRHLLLRPPRSSPIESKSAPTVTRSLVPSMLWMMLSRPRMPRLGSNCVPSVRSKSRRLFSTTPREVFIFVSLGGACRRDPSGHLTEPSCSLVTPLTYLIPRSRVTFVRSVSCHSPLISLTAAPLGLVTTKSLVIRDPSGRRYPWSLASWTIPLANVFSAVVGVCPDCAAAGFEG